MKKPEKKPPPKKAAKKAVTRAPVRARAGEFDRPTKEVPPNQPVEVTLPEVMRVTPETNLRWFAGQYYATHECSVADMAAMPLFSGLSMVRLTKWSVHDSWTAQRRVFQNELRARVQSLLISEISKERVAQLRSLVKLRDKLFHRLKIQLRTVPEGESVPSLVNAYVRLVSIADDFMDKVGFELNPPDAEKHTAPNLPQPELSTQEAREAARLVIQMRRAAAELEKPKA